MGYLWIEFFHLNSMGNVVAPVVIFAANLIKYPDRILKL